MATITIEANPIRFDPYTEHPDLHFKKVARDFENLPVRVQSAQFPLRYFENTNSTEKQELIDEWNRHKKQTLEEYTEKRINEAFETRGVTTLENILSATERIEISVDWDGMKRKTKEKYALDNYEQLFEETGRIERVKEGFLSGDKEAVQKTISGTLKDGPYPHPDSFDELKEIFDDQIEAEYKTESRLLIVDRAVPSPEEIPRRKKIKYVKSRDAFKGKDISKRDFKSLYESIPYQLALRTIHDVFELDEGEVIGTVVFNGWVTSINPATGHEETVCTLSLQASRTEVMGLRLSRVDPKAAFKNLKGVSASKLRKKSPVTPIVQSDRNDSRFTEGRDVGEDMDDGENIAAMNWEDFEHLIRELFESEFSEAGGEVNVTQASRDGGIDAVAFDPDPLRGGKYVIQAKRYTQTVGVSAVRDLYGTVMNEGASKGILVTTSDYGSGAYDFAKDKPIQLLDGGNLLSLLEQHGYDAKIDVEEARESME